MAVTALAGYAGKDIHRGLRILHIGVLDRTSLRHLEGMACIGIEEQLSVGGAAGFFENLLLPGLTREVIAFRIILDPALARHPHMCKRKTIIDGHTMAHVYITGAGTTLDREPGACAEQGDRNAGRKRKCAIILQKHDTFFRCFSCEDAVTLLTLRDVL